MALVVLLKGANVGGHRVFRPSQLAKQMARFDVVNVGAAGTFIVRRPVALARLRAEFRRRLPFAAEIVIVDGADVERFVARDRFGGTPSNATTMRFVSVFARTPRAARSRFQLPRSGRWGLKILGRQGRFVFGLHRREMKAISYLGQLETIYGTPATTRQWSTFLTIARLLTPAI